MGYLAENKFDDISSLLDTVHQRDGQTDGRTDGQTDTGRQQRPRLRIALRGKNCTLIVLIFNILPDIAIFIFGPCGLKLPIHAHFWGSFGDITGFPLELGTCAMGQKTRVLGLPDG